MARDRSRTPEAVRITTAATNRIDDIAARQRRYLLSMTLRSVCFVGAVVAGLAGVDWLWPALIAGALVLPYIAVVMANARTSRTDTFELRDTAYRPELQAGATTSAAAGAADRGPRG